MLTSLLSGNSAKGRIEDVQMVEGATGSSCDKNLRVQRDQCWRLPQQRREARAGGARPLRLHVSTSCAREPVPGNAIGLWTSFNQLTLTKASLNLSSPTTDYVTGAGLRFQVLVTVSLWPGYLPEGHCWPDLQGSRLSANSATESKLPAGGSANVAKSQPRMAGASPIFLGN